MSGTIPRMMTNQAPRPNREWLQPSFAIRKIKKGNNCCAAPSYFANSISTGRLYQPVAPVKK